MSGGESKAEEIVELGIEIINPGGRPDELEQAAKAWRDVKTEIDQIFHALDKQVEGAVGQSWRGPAADAFHEHWRKCKSSADAVTEKFDEAADGLDKAAKAIREVNSEIHEIYLEIGISIGVSVGMSFLTLGVSAATGTARVVMLVEKALDAAGKLGRMLRAVASAYKAFKNLNVGFKMAAEFAMESASGTAGGVVTSVLSGKGPEWETNLAGGIGGATIGAGAGKIVTRLGGSDLISGVVGGAAGGVAGDGLDALAHGKPMDMRQTAITAVAGGAAGGAGGAARGFDKEMTRLAQDIKFGEHTPAGQEVGRDRAWGTTVPVAGGVAANKGKDEWGDVDESAKEGRSDAEQGARGRGTATDEVRDVFG